MRSSILWRWTSGLLTLALLTLGGVTLAQNSAPELRVLQIVDTEPLSGQELGPRQPVSFYFNRPLDCATASNALGVTPNINGEVTCDGTRLTFTPAEAYQRSTTYRFALGPSLLGADGAMLLEAYTLELASVGFLQVAEVFPANSETIEVDTEITVIFNRPVVPLVIAEEQDTLPDPLRFEPAIPGEGAWLNTSIYVYTPAQRLANETRYTVTVQPGLSSPDGAELQQPYSWTFRTRAPSLVERSPESSASGILLERSVQVRFDQEMDRAAVENGFQLLRTENDTATNVPGSFEWSDDGQGFRFTPEARLELDSVYQVRVWLSESQRWEWFFSTVPLPAITGSDPSDGELTRPYGGFSVFFNTLMDLETLQDRVTISPEPAREPDIYYRDSSRTLVVNFGPEPSTTYTITLQAGAQDIYGNPINEPYSFSYTTERYPSDLNLQTPGRVGFYNANREPTQLFLTHRNISEVNLSLRRLDSNALIRQFTQDGYSINRDLPLEQQELVRAWTIPSEAPDNALRYELLNMGPTNSAVTCERSPAPRLQPGDNALVVTEPDPLRARAQPVDGEVVELMYRGYAFEVLQGPVCGDGLTWYQVSLRDDRTGWIAEGLGDDYWVELRDAATTSQITVTDDQNRALPPGVYYLIAQAPGLANRNPSQHTMVVSTAVITMKSSVDTLTVWVTDVQTGAPIPNAPLQIYGDGNTLLGTITTDAEGVARLNVPEIPNLYRPRAALLQTEEHFGIGYTNWTNGIEPWQFGQSYDFYPDEYRIYVYTDRPVYRPGQPVYFRTMIRQKDDVNYTVPTSVEDGGDMRSAWVSIRDDQGNTVYEERIEGRLTEYGTFSSEFTLAEDAGLGFYFIEVRLDQDQAQDNIVTGGIGFNVAEYRVPEFQVEVTPQEDEVALGDEVSVNVDANYFFGGDVSNANVSYNVIANPYTFRYEGPGFYDFTDFNRDGGPGEFFGSSAGRIASGEGTTDANGLFTIEIPAQLEDVTQSYTFSVEAVVTDESNQAVAGRTEVVVHKGLIYVGARPVSYVSRAGEAAEVEVLAVDWDSTGIANQTVDVEVVERRWSSVQERDPATGRTTWTWEVEEIPITTGQVTTDSEGEALYSFVPPEGGTYKVTLTSRDERGNEVRSSTFMWVSGTNYVSWRQQNSNRIDLVTDAQDYSVGDTAEILLTSPFQGTAQALVTVERGDVMLTDWVTMNSNSYVYELPILESYAPNVYVNVMIVKGVDENNPVAGFRAGVARLNVDTERKALNIAISSDVDQAQPQQTITYTVQTSDYAGNPVPAEVGVGVTDLAVLSIGTDPSRPLLDFFYGQQGLQVRTATPLTINTDQLTQETLDTIKGGGGGFGAEGLIEIRGEFIDTPYWNGNLTTDANGQASFDVRLPDNLTTWRLNARALTLAPDGNLLVGQETFDLLSTRPLLIRPVTPRFFVVGDEVILSAVVNNNTEQDQNIVVTLRAEGLTLAEGVQAAQETSVSAGGRVRVAWPVTVPNVEEVQAAFIVEGEGYSDASISGVSLDEEGTLPVYRYEVPETVGTAGTLTSTDARVESIVLPRRFNVTQGTLTVQVDHSLAATALDSLDALSAYRNISIPTLVSRFLPNILTLRALEASGLSDPSLQNALDGNVNEALQRLFAEQKADGGWGWYAASQSDINTTAYALIGLTEARNQGYNVPEGVLNRAQSFLRGRFVTPTLDRPTYTLNRQAFMLYALAYSGDADVGRTVALYDLRQNLSLYARAYLAEVFVMVNPDDTSRTDVLASEFINAAITSAAGIHWEEDSVDRWNWNTDTRTTALILRVLIKLRPESQLLPNVVRYLMVQRQADQWETPQETAWVLMALTDWMVASGELQPDYSYAVSFNEATRLSGSATPQNVRQSQTLVIEVAEMLRDQANTLRFDREGEAGALYYTAYLEAFLPVPEVEALDRGFIVHRSYSLLGDESNAPITEAKVGDLVEVRLTIITPHDRHFVTVEDPIPAGAEAINPGLETSQQVGTRPGLDNSNPLRRGWGWWWFSSIDFYDEKAELRATYLPAGTYEYVYTLRLGVPGTYNVIPTTVQEAFFPDVYGRSEGLAFTVRSGD